MALLVLSPDALAHLTTGWWSGLQTLEVCGERLDIDRALHSQGPSEGSSPHRLLEAVGLGVQPGATPTESTPHIRDDLERSRVTLACRHAQECRPAIRPSTAHTGANRHKRRLLRPGSSPVGRVHSNAPWSRTRHRPVREGDYG